MHLWYSGRMAAFQASDSGSIPERCNFTPLVMETRGVNRGVRMVGVRIKNHFFMGWGVGILYTSWGESLGAEVRVWVRVGVFIWPRRGPPPGFAPERGG